MPVQTTAPAPTHRSKRTISSGSVVRPTFRRMPDAGAPGPRHNRSHVRVPDPPAARSGRPGARDARGPGDGVAARGDAGPGAGGRDRAGGPDRADVSRPPADRAANAPAAGAD